MTTGALETVAVLGATGRTGRLVVDTLEDRGYRVRALARTPSNAPSRWQGNDAITILAGDATNADDVTALLTGADAVISTLGHADGSPANLLTVSIEHVLAAMNPEAIDRLIVLTGAGVRQPEDEPGLLDRTVNLLLGWLQADLLEDSERMAARIQDSATDWTILRATRLTDGELDEPATIAYVGDETGPSVPRAAVAQALVDQLTSDRWLHQAPAISA